MSLKARGKASSKVTRTTRSKRAGLLFPVGRCERMLRQATRGKFRIGAGAPVYLSAVLEYMAAEILELAGQASKDNRRKRIIPRHIQLAVRNDEELSRLYQHVVIPSAGMVPKDRYVLQLLSSKPAASKAGAGGGGGGARTKGKKGKKAKKINAVLKSLKSGGKPIGSLKRVMSREDELGMLQVLHSKKIGTHTLKVVQSDICDITTDAIVHPTNSTLSTGGQIGQAMSRRAGHGFGEEIRKWNAGNSPMPTSGACITPAHKLRAHHVIHVHSPQWGHDDSRKDLHSAVQNIFKLAEKQGLKSIAFPSIGSGANSFPKHTAAAVILRAIQQHFENSPKSTVDEVFFVLFDQTSVAVYKHELINL